MDEGYLLGAKLIGAAKVCMSTSTRWIMIATHTFFIYLACFNGGAVRERFRQKREPVGFRQKMTKIILSQNDRLGQIFIFGSLFFFFLGNSDKVSEFRPSCQNSDKVSANLFFLTKNGNLTKAVILG